MTLLISNTHISLSFHAEALYDDRVWARTKRIASLMSRREIPATFFVYPFRSQVKGISIGDRVQEIAGLGHEIGQHTHFYKGTNIDKETGKEDDLSPANINQCLKRDYDTLTGFGTKPDGFVAGAWVSNKSVIDGIARLGIDYDCSARWPQSGGKIHLAERQFLRSPEEYLHSNTKVIRIPTTCSLGEWFKWGRRTETDSTLPYQLVYLHDYDLLRKSQHALLRLFLILTRRRSFVPAGQLAMKVGELLDQAHG